MKLSKAAIEAAVTKYANKKFKSLLEEADKNKLIAGDHLYNAIFRSQNKEIAAIPVGWFSERSSFSFSIEGFSIENYRVHMDVSRRVPLDGYVRFLPEKASTKAVEMAIENYDNLCKERESIGDRKT